MGAILYPRRSRRPTIQAMMSDNYDVVVIGAGAGGLLTAARLAAAGLSTLVVERLECVGGGRRRATSKDSRSTQARS